MSAAPALRARAGRVAAAGLCALASSCVVACAPPGWSAGAGIEHSRWQEFDASGRRLVREQGSLATLALGLDVQCQGWAWQVALARGQGRRGYDGLSSGHAPLRTSSGIERHTVEYAARMAVAADWSAGARLAYRQLDRDIAGAGAVRGYAERFSDGQLALGLHHLQALGAALQLGTEVWLGGGPAGRLALQLPHADAAVLRLGRSRLLELGLSLRGAGPATATPGWRAQLVYRRERFGAGPAQALWRNGVPVGGAAQPATQREALSLQALATW